MKRSILLLALFNAPVALAQSSPIGWGPGATAVPLSSVVGLYLPNQKVVRYGTDNTTNYVELKAPAGMGSNWSLTLPPDGGTVNYVLRTDGAGVATWVQGATTVAGSIDAMAGYDLAGNIYSVPGYLFNDVTQANQYGEAFGHTVVPVLNAGGHTFSNDQLSLNPAAASDNDSWTHLNLSTGLGTDDSGFTLGAGSNVTGLQINSDAAHKSSVGGLTEVNAFGNIGNATDPITVGNYTSLNLGSRLMANATVGNINGIYLNTNAGAGSSLGNFSGYTANPQIDTMTGGYNSFTSNANIVNMGNGFTSFADYSQITNVTNGYNGVSLGPTMTTVSAYYNGVSDHPAITTTNNGYNGYDESPNIAAMTGVNGYAGLSVHPAIPSVTNPAAGVQGIFIDMSGVDATHTNTAAINVSHGDINAGDSRLSVNKALNAIPDVGGNPQGFFNLISGLTVPAGTTVNGSDAFGVNTAMLIDVQAGSTLTSGALGIGASALGLPAVLTLGAGANIDHVEGATFAVALSNASAGGTAGELDAVRATIVPEGGTQTITKMMGYKFDLPFGDPGATTWGMYMAPPTAHNWLAGDLKIGGTAGSTDIPANASVGLEVQDKAFYPVPMTTVAKNALTPLTGMVVNDSTIGDLEVYETGAWQHIATGTPLVNPMTTLGDTIYEDGTPAATRLPGNTTAIKKFLTQTGTGAVSAAPAWGTIAATDVPAAGPAAPGTVSREFTGVFTATFSGAFTTPQVVTVSYAWVGNLVSLSIPATTAACSTASTISSSDLPAALTPVSAFNTQLASIAVEDNTAFQTSPGAVAVNNASMMTIIKDWGASGAFLGLGTCGWSATASITYNLQ